MHMKYEPAIEVDENGRLFDRRLREHMLAGGRRHPDLPSGEALAALRAASHGFRLAMDRWLDRHGLNEGRMGVLWRLRGVGPMTLGDLATALDVSPRNITGLVDHLEQSGLVDRVPAPDDRRAVHARLTPAGLSLLDKISTEMGGARNDIVRGFTDEELAQLRHLCLKLVGNLVAGRKERESEMEKA
ncbi:MAG: MarR family transcriptional regulator [Candidatus Dormibacteraceae bacterium]